MSAEHQAKIFQLSWRNLTNTSSYAELMVVDMRAVFLGFVGWTWTSFVSLVESKDCSGTFPCVTGGSLWFVKSMSCMSSSCIPNDCEILLKSLS
jgi:hypothetical protein